MEHSLRGSVLVTLLLVGLAACSGPETSASEVSPPDPAPTHTVRKQLSASPVGDCGLLTQAEIEQAFGDALTVTRVSGRGARGGGCTVAMAQGEHSELGFKVGDRLAFELRKQDLQGQSGIRVEPIDLGAEAYLVNGANVIAVNADGHSISLGLTLIVMGRPLPLDADATAAGVTRLAASILGRI
jgi:hypothetical protein